MGNELEHAGLMLGGADACARHAASWASVGARGGVLVLDPELQTSYEGNCVDGKAEGQGSARGSATYAGGFHKGKTGTE